VIGAGSYFSGSWQQLQYFWVSVTWFLQTKSSDIKAVEENVISFRLLTSCRKCRNWRLREKMTCSLGDFLALVEKRLLRAIVDQ